MPRKNTKEHKKRLVVGYPGLQGVTRGNVRDEEAPLALASVFRKQVGLADAICAKAFSIVFVAHAGFWVFAFGAVCAVDDAGGGVCAAFGI